MLRQAISYSLSTIYSACLFCLRTIECGLLIPLIALNLLRCCFGRFEDANLILSVPPSFFTDFSVSITSSQTRNAKKNDLFMHRYLLTAMLSVANAYKKTTFPTTSEKHTLHAQVRSILHIIMFACLSLPVACIMTPVYTLYYTLWHIGNTRKIFKAGVQKSEMVNQPATTTTAKAEQSDETSSNLPEQPQGASAKGARATGAWTRAADAWAQAADTSAQAANTSAQAANTSAQAANTWTRAADTSAQAADTWTRAEGAWTRAERIHHDHLDTLKKMLTMLQSSHPPIWLQEDMQKLFKMFNISTARRSNVSIPKAIAPIRLSIANQLQNPVDPIVFIQQSSLREQSKKNAATGTSASVSQPFVWQLRITYQP